VWEYCVPRRIPFKFIRSRQLLFIRNRKYADRGASGKFVTIYPRDDAELETALRELGTLLDGQPGPYILSDLRWGSGPLYVRYGGFAERYCVAANGEATLAIEDPSGALVPDSRGPTFYVPPWVELPHFLSPHLAARNQTTVADLPYAIEHPLHFSNAGGLYAGIDKQSGERVVFKEARPHAGLAFDGADAVTRLRRERDVLRRLAGLDVVPALRDYFTLGEHEFLVEELVEGTTLQEALVERYPLIATESDAATLGAYTAWALETYAKVETAVDAVHERGIVIGDLHPSNVLVRPDGRVVLIDLEVASDASEERQPTLADPAFFAPGRTGIEIDRYAMACMRLFLFMPITTMFVLVPAKAEQFAEEIAEAFPVPREFLSHAVELITGVKRTVDMRGDRLLDRPPRLTADADGWLRARDSMVQAILSSATPQRDDRLFPGDIRQFTSGGLNLAHGAAGVLYALARTGGGRHPEYEEWLLRRALEPEPGTRLGFYDGLHGVAHVLDRLGRRNDATTVLGMANDELEGKWERVGLDIHSGLAGIGLNLAHFAEVSGDASLWKTAFRVAEIVAERLGDENSVAEISGGEHPHAGLLRGSAGVALLFIRLFERTGDAALLDLAAVALRQDLRRCYLRDDGALEVNEGWRTMPYLVNGSVGIGMVLDDYLAHREDERFTAAAAAIHKAAEAQFYIEPGLFYGRAGMILYLSRGRAPGTGGEDPLIAAHIRRLAWHGVSYRGHLAFPGEQLLRLSMDLASGTAGVLLALGAALNDEPTYLPFLGPCRSRIGIDDSQPREKGGDTNGIARSSGPADAAH